MARIFKWVGWLLLAGIICAGLYLYIHYFVWMRMSPELRANADSALGSGFSMQDDQNDFVIMSSNKEKVNAENNPSPYQLPYLDVRSFQLGNDQNYLYVKIQFYGLIPKKAPYVEGDQIEGVGPKVDLMNEDGTVYAILCTEFGWLPKLGLPVTNTYYFSGPTGIEWPEEKRFTNQTWDSKIFGGPGYDYVMGAYSLNKLGLKPGQTIYFSLQEEAKSAKYTHAAVDVLGGTGKMPSFLSWQLK